MPSPKNTCQQHAPLPSSPRFDPSKPRWTGARASEMLSTNLYQKESGNPGRNRRRLGPGTGFLTARWPTRVAMRLGHRRLRLRRIISAETFLYFHLSGECLDLLLAFTAGKPVRCVFLTVEAVRKNMYGTFAERDQKFISSIIRCSKMGLRRHRRPQFLSRINTQIAWKRH